MLNSQTTYRHCTHSIMDGVVLAPRGHQPRFHPGCGFSQRSNYSVSAKIPLLDYLLSPSTDEFSTGGTTRDASRSLGTPQVPLYRDEVHGKNSSSYCSLQSSITRCDNVLSASTKKPVLTLDLSQLKNRPTLGGSQTARQAYVSSLAVTSPTPRRNTARRASEVPSIACSQQGLKGSFCVSATPHSPIPAHGTFLVSPRNHKRQVQRFPDLNSTFVRKNSQLCIGTVSFQV